MVANENIISFNAVLNINCLFTFDENGFFKLVFSTEYITEL